jgi:hypothetical protein
VSVETRHITIDVRIEAGAISGEVGTGSAKPRPFLGWLGLIAALDGLLGAPEPGRGRPDRSIRMTPPSSGSSRRMLSPVPTGGAAPRS